MPETRKNQSRGACFLGAITLAIWVVLLASPDKEPSAVAREPGGGQRVANRATHYIFAKSPVDGALLFSKTPVETDDGTRAKRDLWFQDARGGTRCVASDIVSARFSPDGQKFAYANNASELFIETIEGKRLAQFAGASDYNWHSDSTAVSFSAMASIDYPDFQQSVVYDLDSGEMTYLSQSE